ncbi:MAG: nucleotidyltransferase domain-containing protein [Betaproteobacteria bacterium]|nr:nucleotidyltransferase domain-containing protein [Betaproteobacteria bacterium]
MGRSQLQVQDVLFSRTQQRLLAAFFSDGDAAFSYAELLRCAGGGSGAIHRELLQFLACGLILEQSLGGRRVFISNARHPLHEELRSMSRKLFGAPAVIRDVLAPYAPGIKRAYIFGSVAKGIARPDSDVDVLVVGSCDYARVLGAMQDAEAKLGRPVSVRFYEPKEYARLTTFDSFIKAVEAGPKIWIHDADGGGRKVVSALRQPRKRRK